jgi:hypothetical protein
VFFCLGGGLAGRCNNFHLLSKSAYIKIRQHKSLKVSIKSNLSA